ncbi:MAG TPA: TolC family protein [Polyangia bacterium]|jgi:outer membrane protein|nr:TolC family protein [Polyangia bacterium]
MTAAPIVLLAALSARTVTLDEAERAAEAQKPAVRAAQAGAAVGAARTEQARAPLLPQVKVAGEYDRTTGNLRQRPGRTTLVNNSWTFYNWFEGQATATQLIWDFGRTLYGWRAAQMRAVALSDTERAARLEAVGTVREAYFRARAAKALIGVAQQTLANLERHLTQITGFVQAGTRPEIDLAQARAGRANARVGVIRAENDFVVARAELNQAMGIAGDTDYDVAEETIAPVPGEGGSIGPLIDEAIRARPDVAALEAQVRAQELAARAARGSYWPTLNAIAGARSEGQSFQQTPTTDYLGNPIQSGGMAWNVWGGFQVTWPLFQGLQTRGQVREADAQLEVARAERDRQVQQVWVAVQQAASGVRAAHEALTASEEALTAARERLRLADGRYTAGVGSIIELSDAELGAATAGAQRVAADYALSTARAALVLALGRK